jgi:hypothetical protein
MGMACGFHRSRVSAFDEYIGQWQEVDPVQFYRKHAKKS